MKKTQAALLAGTTVSALALSLAGASSASAATAGHWWNYSQSKNECLAAPDDQAGIAIQWTCEADPGQNWNTYNLGPDEGVPGNPITFQIYDNVGCISVPASQINSNGARVIVDPNCSSDDGNWDAWESFTDSNTPAGYHLIMNSVSGMCLSVAGGSLSSGAQIIQWTCHDTPDQEWTGPGSSL